MTREEQLEYCQVCSNHKVDFERGIICKLTNRIADFEGECESFEESPRLKAELEERTYFERLENRRAGFGVRMFHAMFDRFASLIILFVIGWLIFEIAPSILKNINVIQAYIIYYAYVIGYYTVLETLTGKTLAKMLTKTQVVNLEGQKPGFGAILFRTLCRFIPLEAFTFLNVETSGWHDTFSNTMVVRDK